VGYCYWSWDRVGFNMYASASSPSKPFTVASSEHYLWAWYHMSFDTEPDIEHTKVHPPNMVMSDFKLCKW